MDTLLHVRPVQSSREKAGVVAQQLTCIWISSQLLWCCHLQMKGLRFKRLQLLMYVAWTPHGYVTNMCKASERFASPVLQNPLHDPLCQEQHVKQFSCRSQGEHHVYVMRPNRYDSILNAILFIPESRLHIFSGGPHTTGY